MSCDLYWGLNRSPRGSGRIDGVDLLRGLAIFFVLMNHVNMRLLGAEVPYTHGLPKQLVSSLVWNGQFGVQIFFAVSGFLITSTTIRRWGALSRVSMRGFYLMRFARIVPLLLLLLTLLSLLHFAHIKYFVVSAKTGGLGRALFAALTFHVNVLEARHGYLPGSWDILWSLSVEEVFYLVFPVTARALFSLTAMRFGESIPIWEAWMRLLSAVLRLCCSRAFASPAGYFGRLPVLARLS
jgi:peptidoglycan/LPS O-acetylase OafA/YrhL